MEAQVVMQPSDDIILCRSIYWNMARIGALITLMLSIAACVAAGIVYSRDSIKAAAICGFAGVILFILSMVLFFRKPVHRKDGAVAKPKKA
jgi:hypothetical protein